MQATVFGLMTDEIRKSPLLATRFDYDTHFGTVMNRFTVQAALSLPLTVYGTGWQRTGLMALDDAIRSLASMSSDSIEPGQHRIINHVGETDLCIRDIAEVVSRVAQSQGLAVRVSCDEFDPRGERTPSKESYRIETPWLKRRGFEKRNLDEVVLETLGVVRSFRTRIRTDVLAAAKPW
jgi:UDP-sulfoquinovose synthase